MSKHSDQEYLLTSQYNNADKLNARIQLHWRFSTNKYDWSRWVFDHLQIPALARILEVGCGPAKFWLKNMDRIPVGWDITLSDFSPGMLQEAKQNLHDSLRGRPQGSLRIAFEVFDVQSIPFDNAHFDAIIANHMLYHVPDRAKALAEIRRVLKPGGHLYAATNGQNHLLELHELLEKFDPYTMARWFSSASSMPFRLESGSAELSPWFSSITLHRYESDLLVTEAEPLVAYVLSMFVTPMITGEKINQFRSFVEQELAAHGPIHITKDTGLFEAS